MHRVLLIRCDYVEPCRWCSKSLGDSMRRKRSGRPYVIFTKHVLDDDGCSADIPSYSEASVATKLEQPMS